MVIDTGRRNFLKYLGLAGITGAVALANAKSVLANTIITGNSVTTDSIISKIGRNAFTLAASDTPSILKNQADMVCDGTNDQVEIQAAIDMFPSGGSIHFLPGVFNCSKLSITTGSLALEGSQGAILQKTGASGNLIEIGHAGSMETQNTVKNLVLRPGVNQVSGAMIYAIDTLQATIQDVWIIPNGGYTPFVGIDIENGSSVGELSKNSIISNCYMRLCSSVGIGVGISANDHTKEPLQCNVSNVQITECGIGIQSKSSGGLMIYGGSGIGHCNIGIDLSPDTNQQIYDFTFCDSWIDQTAANGFQIWGAGDPNNITINNATIQTSGAKGIYLGSPRLKTMDIAHSYLNSNGDDGIQIEAGQMINIIGNRIQSSGYGHGGTGKNGVTVYGGINKFTIMGNQLDSTYAAYGVYVAGTNNDGYIICNNRGGGGVSGMVRDDGTGAQKYVGNNLSI